MENNDKTIKGRRNRGVSDPHATGRANRAPHATGRANRDVHATGRANRDVHATGRASRGETDPHATGRALRPFEQGGSAAIDLRSRQANASGAQRWPDFFDLDGVRYKNEGILSDSSGEAIVFTVSNAGRKYALKIYYYDPDHRPNHDVLERISRLNGSNLLVNLVSHGEWSNPNLPGEKNDYELMDFCEGGSLDGVILDGNEKAIADVALQIGGAINFLAQNGILHRDIKPANFFYADKAKTRIVLADFGISVECPPGGFVKIDEMRSPVYAAPEFYTNVPGEPAEVGVESDYYSLGVALLCLWMGKDKLMANESQLLRQKLNETLPMPKDMSLHTVSLIKALTRLKMTDRAGFADIQRWASGQNLSYGDDAAADGAFKIIYNSAKNQVAHSPAELAALLVADKLLGKKYLYSGRVTRWLEETGRNEIAVNVEEIAEKIYPRNQEAGLMTVAYMLDPAMDYVAPDGRHFSDPAEIAYYVFEHWEEMADEVLDPDSNLMIYFHAQKLDKTIETLRRLIDSEQFENIDDADHRSILATYYLAILLQDMPFPVFTEEGWQLAHSTDELLDIFHEEGYIDTMNSELLTSDAFIVWLSYRNPALAGKIRMLRDNVSDDPDSLYYNADSDYRTLYELDPRVDFRFNTDPNAQDRIYTVQQLGEYLNDTLNEWTNGDQPGEIFSYLFQDMDNHEIADYMRARGEQYMNFLRWNRHCADLGSEENSSKAGPYNAVTAAYKTTAGFLGHTPTYKTAGIILQGPDDVSKLNPDQLKAAIAGYYLPLPPEEEPDGTPPVPMAWLDSWLPLFYEENPWLDLSQPFTYENATAQYVEFLGSIDPDNYYARRYNYAIGTVDNATEELHESDEKLKKKRLFFLLFAGLPALFTFICSWFFARPENDPITGHWFTTFILCTVAVGVSAGFYYRNFLGTVIIGPLGGLALSLFIWAGFAWFPGFLYLLGGVALVLGSATLAYLLFQRHKVDTGGKEIRGDEFEYRQLDALYFAYRDTSDSLQNTVTQYVDNQQRFDKATREDIDQYGWMWACGVWLITIIWFFATPGMSGSSSWGNSGPRPLNSKEQLLMENSMLFGDWSATFTGGTTNIKCHVSGVTNVNEISGTMEIAGQPAVPAHGYVNNVDGRIESFSFYPDQGGNANKRRINVVFNANDDNAVWGYYLDRNGKRHDLTFTETAYGHPAR